MDDLLTISIESRIIRERSMGFMGKAGCLKSEAIGDDLVLRGDYGSRGRRIWETLPTKPKRISRTSLDQPTQYGSRTSQICEDTYYLRTHVNRACS